MLRYKDNTVIIEGENGMPSPEITKADLITLADSWFDRLGETKERIIALDQSPMPLDIVSDQRNDIFQTFLNHFFLQPDFNQSEYNMDPVEYIRSHAQHIIPELSRDRLVTFDHAVPTIEHLSWEPDSTIDQIGKYLGLAVHTEGQTPIMTIEETLLKKMSNIGRSKLTGFV